MMIMMTIKTIFYQVLMSEVRRFGRDFDSRQLTKTLTLKFERLQSKINPNQPPGQMNRQIEAASKSSNIPGSLARLTWRG